MQEFFGSLYFLLLVVAVTALILVREMLKAVRAGQKGMVISLCLTMAVLKIATWVVLMAQ